MSHLSLDNSLYLRTRPPTDRRFSWGNVGLLGGLPDAESSERWSCSFVRSNAGHAKYGHIVCDRRTKRGNPFANSLRLRVADADLDLQAMLRLCGGTRNPILSSVVRFSGEVHTLFKKFIVVSKEGKNDDDDEIIDGLRRAFDNVDDDNDGDDDGDDDEDENEHDGDSVSHEEVMRILDLNNHVRPDDRSPSTQPLCSSSENE